MMAEPQHGGRRPNAGRKPLEGGRVTAAFALRQDQLDWLDQQARAQQISKSAVVRDLIDQHRTPQH